MKNSFQLSSCILFAILIITGCSKHIESSSKESQQQTNTKEDELVATPIGLFPKSHVHVVPAGSLLKMEDGHLLQKNIRTGETIKDFGLRGFQNQDIKELIDRNYIGNNVSQLPDLVVGNTHYVTFAQWENTSSQPITSFTTNWTVPNNPVTNDNQVLYLWMGLLNPDGDVMQPVLQWGATVAGGGNYWAIANWYVYPTTSGHSDFIISTATQVSPGTNLQGVITLNSVSADGSYNYTSSFSGTGNSLLVIEGNHNGKIVPLIPEQNNVFEALECFYHLNGTIQPGVFHASDYPSGLNYMIMNNIATSVNNAFVGSTFHAGTKTANFGEHTFIAGDPHFVGFPPVYSTGMQMIYFHAAPLINGSSIAGLTASGTPCTVVGYAGSTVSMKVNVTALRPPGTATGTFTITTPGVTFANGSTSITATTNSTVTQTVVLPSSGQISGTATIHVTSGSANGGVAVN